MNVSIYDDFLSSEDSRVKEIINLNINSLRQLMKNNCIGEDNNINTNNLSCGGLRYLASIFDKHWKERKNKGRQEAFSALIDSGCQKILTLPGVSWSGESMFLSGAYGKIDSNTSIVGIEANRNIFKTALQFMPCNKRFIKQLDYNEKPFYSRLSFECNNISYHNTDFIDLAKSDEQFDGAWLDFVGTLPRFFTDVKKFWQDNVNKTLVITFSYRMRESVVSHYNGLENMVKACCPNYKDIYFSTTQNKRTKNHHQPMMQAVVNK